ncbi:MAG: hypothetical protein JWO33_2719 [Caulobacteraceae bacterium]|nr:hypothetical protein [Caulobacteraceae bacterium]
MVGVEARSVAFVPPPHRRHAGGFGFSAGSETASRDEGPGVVLLEVELAAEDADEEAYDGDSKGGEPCPAARKGARHVWPPPGLVSREQLEPPVHQSSQHAMTLATQDAIPKGPLAGQEVFVRAS